MQDLDELSVRDRAILASGWEISYVDGLSQRRRRPLFEQEPHTLVARTRTYYSRGKAFLVQWQDFGQSLPVWFDGLMQGVVDLLTLPAGWSSYSDTPIQQAVVNRVIEASNELLGESTPAPHVVPLSSGGLQLEWHKNQRDLEIVFDVNEAPYFYYRDRRTAEEIENEITGREGLLKRLVSELE